MRAMIRAGVASAVLGGFAFGGGPSVMLDSQQVPAGSFDDRSAPSTYQYDAPPYTGWFGSSGAEFIGVNQFDAVGGSDLIKTVSCVWRGVANGSTQRLFVWQDDGSGVFSNARLLTEQSVVVANAGTTISNSYALASPVAVTGRFYVGFSSIWSSGTGVCAFQLVSLGSVPDHSLIGARIPPFDPASPSHLNSLYSVTAQGFSGSFAVRADGAGSSFAYQGRLTENGANYSGTADFLFTVCDAAQGDGTIGVPVAIGNVSVIGGVFSVQIPADPSWFVGAPDRYLQVAVRTPGDSGTYRTLSPRQRIAQAPAAMVSTLSQSSLSVPWSGVTGVPPILAAWQPATGGIAYNAGNIGIGTSTPTAAVHVVGGPTYAAAQFENNYTAGTWLNVANSSSNGRLWSLVSTGSSNTEGAGALLIRDTTAGAVRATFLPNGRVGLGTITPTEALDVRGNIRLGSSGQYQAAAGQAEALATLRGVVNADGTIRHGTGFTVTRQGIGNYRLSWSASPGFSDYPSFIGNGSFTNSPTIVWVSEGFVISDRSGYVVVRITNLLGNAVDSPFSFTLTGPR
ncbi:MAG: hypothetical protein U0570_04490 [Phycisphaerales bacterium]